MSYIDGFVCAVPTNKREEYQAHASKAANVFKKFGAERVVEAWGMMFLMERLPLFHWL